jgi:hypothetical protein
MSWPELPAHWAIDILVYTILLYYVLGTSCILGRLVLVLVGLLQPLVPLLDQTITRTVVNYNVMPGTFKSLGNRHLGLHHPSVVCIRNIIYIWETGAGFGCDAAASGSVIRPEHH